MVLTRSTVKTNVGDANDLSSEITIGNAKERAAKPKRLGKEGIVGASTQQEDDVASSVRKRQGESVVHTGLQEKAAKISEAENVNRSSWNSKPLPNSEPGVVLDQNLKNGRKSSLASPSLTGSNVSKQVEDSSEELQKARRKHRKKKMKTKDALPVNSLSKCKKQIKHFLSRIKMEQNLIEAYSGEGWKGLSREKIRPEKELQRAEAQILKCKLAIREVIHDLCLKCLEGSIRETAFDSQGQIPVDEIFCAKCFSHEEYADNDIILCDGACNRAFHQNCLEPPLAAHDIPPDDEGWLCPECDCKFDCFDLISDFLEEDFELETSWEQIFPEADPANLPSSEGLGDWPSDDSEDEDFDPDQLDAEKITNEDDNRQDSEGSSSESNSSSDSSCSEEQSGCISEDDHAALNEDKRKLVQSVQKKGKDVTASEEDDEENGNLTISEKRQRIEVDYKKLNDEMYGKDSDGEESSDDEWGPWKRKRSKLQSSQNEGASTESPLSSKRSKKVTENAGGRQSKAASQRKASVKSKGKQPDKLNDIQAPIQKCDGNEELVNRESANNESGTGTRRKRNPKLPTCDSASTMIKSYNSSRADDSTTAKTRQPERVSGRKASADHHNNQETTEVQEGAQNIDKMIRNKMPADTIQRLKEVFAENTLPSKALKESLAKELGLSAERVSLWFKSQRKYLALKKRRSVGTCPVDNSLGLSKGEPAD